MAKRKGLNGEGTVFQIPNGKWKAQITFWDASGKRRRPSRTCNTKAEAYAAKRKLLAEWEGLSGSGAILNLTAYLNQWWTNRIDGVRSKNTAASYKLAIEKHITPRIGRIPLSKLKPRDIENWIAQLRRDEVGSRTIQNAFVVLKSALKYATRLNDIASNPCDGVGRPRYQAPEVAPFTPEETIAILKECDSEWLGILFVIALHSGARQGELLGLEWYDVDFENSSFRIRQQLIEGSGFLEISSTLKTKSSRRSVTLSSDVMDRLNQHRAELLRMKHLDRFVFVDSRGGLLRKSNVQKVWSRIQKNAGIDQIRGFHVCRHTYCSLQLTSGLNPKLVASVTGHKDVAVLLNTYAHLFEGAQQEAAANIQERLKNG